MCGYLLVYAVECLLYLDDWIHIASPIRPPCTPVAAGHHLPHPPNAVKYLLSLTTAYTSPACPLAHPPVRRLKSRERRIYPEDLAILQVRGSGIM